MLDFDYSKEREVVFQHIISLSVAVAWWAKRLIAWNLYSCLFMAGGYGVDFIA